MTTRHTYNTFGKNVNHSNYINTTPATRAHKNDSVLYIIFSALIKIAPFAAIGFAAGRALNLF